MNDSPRSSAIGAVSSLDDPVRRSVWDFVAGRSGPVDRDDTAAALGLARSTAAFHLDRLAAAGLLVTEYRHRGERRGPGSGRPAKFYRVAPEEITVSVPDRDYRLMGELLAGAIAASAEGGRPVLDELDRVAHEAGAAHGRKAGSLAAVLEGTGYLPRTDEQGTILAGCPFHRLVEQHPGVVCAANHGYLRGAAEGVGEDPDRVLLDPAPGRCCVRIAPDAGDPPAESAGTG